MIFDIQSYRNVKYKNEILYCLTVALALVPEAVAFALVAGVPPLVGLYAAFIVCLITSIFGGRPGMISGATGALAVVMVSLVTTHGVEYLFATVVLMGILQVIFGIFKLGKYIRLVPEPVIYGFVNGLAIVIACGEAKAGAVSPVPIGQQELPLGCAVHRRRAAGDFNLVWQCPCLTVVVRFNLPEFLIHQ